MKNRLALALVLLGPLSACGLHPAHGQSPNGWTFSLPVSSISGSPGATIGWGYMFVNNSPNEWLFVTDITSDSGFQHGTATTSPFDFPVLMPNSSVTESYSGTSGLVDFTWDANAPDSFVNSGNFIVSAYYYDGDPFAGGTLIGDAGTRQATYHASVAGTAGSAVPEASSVLTFAVGALGLGGLVIAAKRRKARLAA